MLTILDLYAIFYFSLGLESAVLHFILIAKAFSVMGVEICLKLCGGRGFSDFNMVSDTNR